MNVIPMECNGEPKPKLFSLRLHYNGRSINIPVDYPTMGAFVLEAQLLDLQVGELLAQVIREYLDRVGEPE